MDEKITTPATPSLETPRPANEEPLVELRVKKWLFYYAILMIVWGIWFSIFGAIIPYLNTGDFNEIWPAHKYDASEKVVLFVISWILLPCLPCLAGAFRAGMISFYETYVEQSPYLPFFKKITIPYDTMHIKEKSTGMRLTNGSVPPWHENQFKYWKTLWWEGIGISWIDMGYTNPECLPQAIQLARERGVKIDRAQI